MLSRLLAPARSALTPSTRLISTVQAPHGGPQDYAEKRRSAEMFAEREGWDVASLWEQQVAWGHHDGFAHVNNAKYLTYLESGRMRFVQKIAQEINAEASLVRGQPGGIGVILGSITVNYRRPVTFPDTLFVAHRVKEMAPTKFVLDQMCYSLEQQKVVTTGTADMVCYDYGSLKKMEMTPEFKAALEARMKKPE